MRLAFTADDGTNFETEGECLAYEGISADIACIYHRGVDDAEQQLRFQQGFCCYLTEGGFYDAQTLMKYRGSLLRLAVLLQPMEGCHYFGSITQDLCPHSQLN